MTKTRSGRVTKAPTRYGSSSETGIKIAKRKPVAAKTKKTTTAQKLKKKTTTKTTKKVTPAKKAAPAKKATQAKKAAQAKKATQAKTTKKQSSPKKPKAKKTAYALKPGTTKEAVLPDVSSSLSKADRDELNSMNTTDLKRVLKFNDCICTGTKEELRTRVAWNMKNGVPKRCPQCHGGRLKLDVNGTYFCPGSYDDDEYVRCSYTTSKPETVPWKKESTD